MKLLNKIIITIISILLISCVPKVSSQAHSFAFLLKLLLGDKTPPLISFTSPDSVDNGYETNKSFTAVFSEHVSSVVSNPLSLSLNGIDVPGSAEFVNNSLIFKPTSQLAANTKYTVNIQGVQDKSGNSMVGVYQYSFTTGSTVDTIPISIKSTSPTADASNVELNAKIAIEFNEALNPKSVVPENFTLKANGVNVEYSFDYVGNILFIKPTQDLAAYTYYTFTINKNITDTTNLPLGSDYTINFLTTNAKDITPPNVTQSYPEKAIIPAFRGSFGENVFLNTVVGNEIQPAQMVMVDFSEAVINVLPDANILVTKVSDNSVIPFGVRRGLSSVTIFPRTSDNKWTPGEKYKLTILSTVTDLATNIFPSGNYELTFPVAQIEIPIVPPTISLQSPSNTETDVILKTKIKMVFSKPIFRPAVTIDSIYIQDPLGNKIMGTYSFPDNFTALFTPASLLAPNTVYTGYVKTNVKGLENKKLASDYSYSFTTESLDPPSSISYSNSFFPLTKNKSTQPLIPAYSGYITSCTSSPTLPTGLFLLSNCTIYGTPQNSQNTKVYTITGANQGGSNSVKISIAISEPGQSPLYLVYSGLAYTVASNFSISPITPSVQGNITSCSITPTLPLGLSIDSSCVITGTPTEFVTNKDFTVTATNASQTAEANLKLTVANSVGTRVVNASISNTTIWEGIGNATVTISLTSTPNSLVGVDYTTTAGTATAGSDYTTSSGTIYFRVGETSKTVSIPIINDSVYEGNENFTFQITQVLGDTSILGTSSLNLTISDLDISNGLVAYHPFNGNATDSITSTSATLFGTGGTQNLPQLTTDRKGNLNSAYLFDGTDDYIVAGSNVGITGNSPRTLSTWIKHPVSPTNTIQHQVYWGNVVTSQPFGLYTTSVVIFYGQLDDLNSGQTLTTTWDHWVFVYNSTTVFSYKNGIFINQANKTLNTGNTPLYFGRRMDNLYYFAGSLDDVRVYNRAMDADEVRALYELEK